MGFQANELEGIAKQLCELEDQMREHVRAARVLAAFAYLYRNLHLFRSAEQLNFDGAVG